MCRFSYLLFRASIAALFAAGVVAPSLADDGVTDDTPADDQQPAAVTELSNNHIEELPNILVIAEPLDTDAPFADTYSLSQRDREDITRFQANDLFKTIEDVPGVGVAGGPLPGGKQFVIRGFGDTEDVATELDGVPRDFEKYRFGAGVFIDPTLLRSVEVWRQPSVRITPGSIGGAVRAWSRAPAEVLEPDARLGGELLAGFAFNNDQQRYAGNLAAQPVDYFGALFAVSELSSNDIRLADGTRLENSAADSTSWLGKLVFTPGDVVTASLSYQGWRDDSLQAFDATSGQPGFFGYVRRRVEDDTFTVILTADPAEQVALFLSTGYTHTRVFDTHLPGESFIANPSTGVITDSYDYESAAFRAESIFNTPSRWGEWTLYAGIDGLLSRRDVTRLRELVDPDPAYPNGYYRAQPPGEKSYWGLYALAEWSFRALTLRGGERTTWYRAEALGQAATDLQALNEASSIRFAKDSREWGAELALPANVVLFYNYIEAFRPPLIDEYFTNGEFSNCLPYLLSDPTLAPASGVCGELYVPEDAESSEYGVAYTGGFGRARGGVKVTVFDSDVSNTLESIDTVNGVFRQPGREHREGWELEADIQSGMFFSRIGYARIEGDASLDGTMQEPLYGLPPNRFTLLAGVRPWDDRVELGYQFAHIAAREVLTGSINPVPMVEPAYSLHDAYLNFWLTEQLLLRLIGTNLNDESYALNNGFGGSAGTAAPGRNVEVIASIKF